MPAPKGKPKETIPVPGGNVSLMHKHTPPPKETYKPRIVKNKPGDLVKPNLPRPPLLVSPFMGEITIVEQDKWIFRPNVTFKDGSKFDPPIRKSGG